MSLSDKRHVNFDGDFYWERDVKAFIKKIIDKFEGMEIVSGEVIKYEIRKEAGRGCYEFK